MTQVFHALVGYDRRTGKVAAEYEVPTQALPLAKQVAGVGEDDPDAALSYMLTPRQAIEIAEAINAPADTRALNFYLEGYDAPLGSTRDA